MDHDNLALHLAEADEGERAVVLARYSALATVGLARALKRLYDTTESRSPSQAAGAAASLALLAERQLHPEIQALAHWTTGMAAIDSGQMEAAIAHLNVAQTGFLSIGQARDAAATQVSKLIALAILGRYKEAIACGLQTRDLFLDLDDSFAAGKIEQNLGNIYHRRGQYIEAEQLFRSAWARFDVAGDQKQLAQVENCLGIELMFQHRFAEANELYEQALGRAKAASLTMTQAEIECNLGNLALFQGRYDRALAYLEYSRRHYAALNLPHELAIAELELADAYLELNLLHEAGNIYQRVAPIFEELGMRAEQARALTQHSRVYLLRGHIEHAYELLERARTLYSEEDNPVGAALVMIIEAQVYYTRTDYSAAIGAAEAAEAPFAAVGSWGNLLVARWLKGEALRALGQHDQAETMLAATRHDAEQHGLPQIAQRCYTSLGLLARAQGGNARAEEAFQQAIVLIEQMRAPLPNSEFRAEFIADKLAPYAELVRLSLAHTWADSQATDARQSVVKALEYTERARARSLIDTLHGSFFNNLKARDGFEADLLACAEQLRSQLNWLYNQINRLPDDGDAPQPATVEGWHATVRENEEELLRVMRQLQQSGGSSLHAQASRAFDIDQLQQELGNHTALVEYFCLDGELLAFVVTDESVEVVQHLGQEAEVETIVTNLRNQMAALRYKMAWSPAQMSQLKHRTRRHLHDLYNLLLYPLEPWLGERRIVVVPHRIVHYVPFHALYDGNSHMIERCEIVYAPSAAVLQHCLAQPVKAIEQALLVGVSDVQVPKVHDEVTDIAALFPQPTVLLNQQATLEALRQHAPQADLLHLACHGQFRPDNPLFSSLRLGDGWLTVLDATTLDLNCALVVLSACETGMSAVMPGDELVGLARSFFSAGTPAILVSLWTVDDETTADYMKSFYSYLQQGATPSAALRYTQCAFLQQGLHPFFWSPFVLIGRW